MEHFQETVMVRDEKRGGLFLEHLSLLQIVSVCKNQDLEIFEFSWYSDSITHGCKLSQCSIFQNRVVQIYCLIHSSFFGP